MVGTLMLPVDGVPADWSSLFPPTTSARSTVGEPSCERRSAMSLRSSESLLNLYLFLVRRPESSLRLQAATPDMRQTIMRRGEEEERDEGGLPGEDLPPQLWRVTPHCRRC